jgi:hypothetical protein
MDREMERERGRGREGRGDGMGEGKKARKRERVVSILHISLLYNTEPYRARVQKPIISAVQQSLTVKCATLCSPQTRSLSHTHSPSLSGKAL